MGGISSQSIKFESVKTGAQSLMVMVYNVFITASNPLDIYAMSLAVILDIR